MTCSLEDLARESIERTIEPGCKPPVRSSELLAELRELEIGLRKQASNLIRQDDDDGFRRCAAVAEGVALAVAIVMKSANEKGQR